MFVETSKRHSVVLLFILYNLRIIDIVKPRQFFLKGRQMTQKSKRDTAVWSTQNEMRDGLAQSGDKFISEKRPVRIHRDCGRISNGTIKSIASDHRSFEFTPVGSEKVERVTLNNLSQFSVMSMPFGRTLDKRRTSVDSAWM